MGSRFHISIFRFRQATFDNVTRPATMPVRKLGDGSMRSLLSSGAAGLLLFSPAAFGQNGDIPGGAPATTMPEVVVTATRIPTDPGRLGSAFSVVTAEEIERRQAQTVIDALRPVPGLTIVQQGGPGTTSSLFLRGTNSEHVLFLVNGLPVGDPASGGIFDPANLGTENVERIEVIRGPQSVLYGSDAIGGVINIITKSGAGPLTTTASAELGTQRTLELSAGIGGAISDRANARFDVSHLSTDGATIAPERLGNDEEDGYRNFSASGSFDVDLTDRIGAGLFGQYTRGVVEIDDFGADDPNYENFRSIRILQGHIRAELVENVWSARLTGGITDQDYDNIDPPNTASEFRSSSYFDGRTVEFGLQNDFTIRNTDTLTLGAETQNEHGETSGDAFGGFDESIRTDSAYAQYQFELGERWSGTVGGRIDDHESFGAEATYRVSGAYHHTETDTRLRGSIGTGFKAPSLLDLFGEVPGLYVGNPDLKPEESLGWDVGIDQYLFDDAVVASVTYFHNDIDELINGFVVDPDTGLFTAQNVDEAETYGIETHLSVKATETVTLDANYTYTRAKNGTTGEDLLRRPKHTASLAVFWSPVERATLGAEADFVGRRLDFDGELPSYTVVNLNASYDLTDDVVLFGRVNNLFDREYEDPSLYQHPGIEAFAGLRVTF